MPSGLQGASLSSRFSDPLVNFKYHVFVYTPETYQNLFAGQAAFGFSSISGIGVQIDSTEYRQAGVNLYVHHMPTQATFSPITLSKGVICGDNTVNAWIERVYDVIQGSPARYSEGDPAAFPEFRATVDICVVAHPSTTRAVQYKAGWRLYNAWVAGMVYGDLDAAGNGILLQQMLLKYEGFRFRLADRGDRGESTYPAF